MGNTLFDLLDADDVSLRTKWIVAVNIYTWDHSYLLAACMQGMQEGMALALKHPDVAKTVLSDLEHNQSKDIADMIDESVNHYVEDAVELEYFIKTIRAGVKEPQGLEKDVNRIAWEAFISQKSGDS